ncbi:DUF2281 domain-containing protein [candidate division KSB1 bacterium]|nr:MAG: DUF2281 domain-containing protein [candidate division KSB1 bacterium]MBC6952428.1 DUF2281 domain-containing protein [candidate division KSB1 bacterium]MCE7943852.1 DUF2281 domain-containing protein [Chlorobi bacterium CHB1]MDL1877802.1 DUF2281 domain-containing protein [Cytophagia bacterium CHB2]
MSTRDQIKSEIDKLPDEALQEVQIFLRFLKTKPPAEKRKQPSFKLNGRFDSLDIRREAYE